jgi:hypothetical protein
METETFWTLLRDLPHWEFELFLIFIFDILIGALIWPRIKKFSLHHKEDDDKLAALERRIAELEKNK